MQLRKLIAGASWLNLSAKRRKMTFGEKRDAHYNSFIGNVSQKNGGGLMTSFVNRMNGSSKEVFADFQFFFRSPLREHGIWAPCSRVLPIFWIDQSIVHLISIEFILCNFKWLFVFLLNYKWHRGVYQMNGILVQCAAKNYKNYERKTIR